MGGACPTLDAAVPLRALAALVVGAWILYAAVARASALWRRRWERLEAAALAAGFFCAGLVLAADARASALATPLRDLLEGAFGGFLIEMPGPAGTHDPLSVRVTLLEDASPGSDVTSLRASLSAVRLHGRWHDATGGVTLTVGGVVAKRRAGEWRAGRRVEMPATFRRPARYLNEGVRDFERDLALGGTTLFGSVKSGLLVEVVSHGSTVQEAAARVRIHVRRSVDRWVRPYDPVSAAIVTAVLIGDRTGLPADVRLRLQAAGTYHVIAISGGNIAILAGLTLVLLLVSGVTGRPAALATILVLVAYAQVVTAEASVWRATLMAALYLAARILDHRSPPWHTMAVAAVVVVCARPLDVRAVGFILTFGATAALLEGARRAVRLTSRRPLVAWPIASVAASFAVEAALLPVSAWTFSRVTSAGLVLNLAAVPLMGVVQVAGLIAAGLDGVETIARPAGWVAHLAARGIVSSAGLVEVAPWLSTRVPPPTLALILTYYTGLGAALVSRGGLRLGGIALVAATTVAIATGARPGGATHAPPRVDPPLRITVFDVGQGDSTLLQFPDGSALVVDAGGIPFGAGFDIGGRVLAPALWTRGVRSIDALLLTHGDPDHIGGARSVLRDFAPTEVWQGVPVPGHVGLHELLQLARGRGARVERRQAGEELHIGGGRIRVLHPPPPEWERPRVRNDDSVVIEVVYRDVAVLLAGDVSADIERQILSRLTPARVRILKVPHHGSRTSSSRELLESWRPQVAVISCGRGNTFGHPAPEVLRRLEAVGATVYRTDLDGQVTIETNGRNVHLRTHVRERRERVAPGGAAPPAAQAPFP